MILKILAYDKLAIQRTIHIFQGEKVLDAQNQEQKTKVGFVVEEKNDESLDLVISKMRNLELFDGIDDPYAELMRERGIEVRK